jgi:hypothetical protein
MIEEMTVVYGPQPIFYNFISNFSKNLMRKSLK